MEYTLAHRFHLILLLLTSLMLGACGGGSSSGNSNPITDPDIVTVGCVDNDGLDLFVAEAAQALALSWNNQGGFDASGGYRVRFGFRSEDYSASITVACTALDCETTLIELDNDIPHYIVVDSLNSNDQVTGTSCEVTATPHIVQFNNDIPVSSTTAVQANPTIASGWDGTPLFLGWVESGSVLLSRSDDFGASWSSPTMLWANGGAESNPNLSFRRRIVETDPDTGELQIVGQPALFATFVVDGQVKILRGDFPTGPENSVEFSTAIDLGSGDLPVVTAYADHVEVVYERDAGIWASSSADGGNLFSTAQRIDMASGTGQFSAKPDVIIDPNSDDVFVVFHGQRTQGNTDIYLNYSRDSGVTYQTSEIRVDDDTSGQNQSNVSISVDPRTSHILATWEDRRGGSNVYFSRSLDGGVTWEANLNSGAGLNGDQFEPTAEVDPGRNVYVLFIDTSSGHKPLFTRFNALGSFDSSFEVSSSAGQAGAVAHAPVLTIDKLGRFYAAWIENRDGSPDNLYFARAE